VSPDRRHEISWIWPATLVGRLGILLVALIVAATAFASLLDYRQDRILAMERAHTELQSQTDLVVERLRREIHDRYRSVDLWPELEAAQDLAVDDLDRRLSASLLQLATSYGTGDLALGVGTGGTVLAASEASLIGRELAGSAFFLRLDSLANAAPDTEGSPSSGSPVDVALLPNREEEGLPAQGVPGRDTPVLAFSHRVTAWADGRPLGWIVLLTPWPTLVESLAQELRTGLAIQGQERAWYAGDSIQGREGPWVTAVQTLGGDLPETMEVSLRIPESAVLAPLRGAGIRLAGLAALFLVVVVPPLLLLLRVALRELRRLTQTATAMDPENPGSFGEISPAAPHEVRILASALAEMLDRLEASRKELAHRESLAAVGVLAAGLAHEIRTPLSVLRASAEMLERNGTTTDREQELITFIQEEVARLARLVEDLLLFARPRPPELGPVELGQVLTRTTRALAGEAAEREITVDTDASPVRVRGDAEQLYQVGLNLLGNALSVSGPGTRVRLSTRQDEGMGWLTVKDEGPGIAPGIMERIWDPLFTTRTSGTGLGLAVVKRIVQEHHGLIRVDSRPGEGARFTVGIPLLEEGSEHPKGRSE
jgi:two-component system sensor histidine kinase HydH